MALEVALAEFPENAPAHVVLKGRTRNRAIVALVQDYLETGVVPTGLRLVRRGGQEPPPRTTPESRKSGKPAP